MTRDTQLAMQFYPHAPGWKAQETSRDAARAMKLNAESLRLRAANILRRGPATADEVARWLGESILAIRPRMTELFKQGLIEDSGERRKNDSGKSAIVWRAKC